MTHAPVLLKEVVALLETRPDSIVLDATFGRGGYSRAILAKGGQVIGLDRDPDAVKEGEKLAAENPRFRMLRGSFGALDLHLKSINVDKVDGIAMDLGVSSPQFDNAERGFSFRHDGPLDMRMDPTGGESAADLVNNRSENELAKLIYDLGEERFARQIARAITTARGEMRISTTHQLAEIVRQTVRPSKDGIDPATRTFQALRIAVNDELGQLEEGLAAAERVLDENGRLVVVSFHSLEDRIVKEFMRERSGRSPSPSRHLPAAVATDAGLRLLTSKPVTPSEEELRANPRSRSSRLRAATKLSKTHQGGVS